MFRGYVIVNKIARTTTATRKRVGVLLSSGELCILSESPERTIGSNYNVDEVIRRCRKRVQK